MSNAQRIIHDDGTLRALGAPPSTSHLSLLQERANASAERFAETMRKLRAPQAVDPGRFGDGREVS